MAVSSIMEAKKMSPALITESRLNAIASEGSTGVIVEPVVSQCAMCSAINTCTPISTSARHLPAFDGRGLGRGVGVDGASVDGMTSLFLDFDLVLGICEG